MTMVYLVCEKEQGSILGQILNDALIENKIEVFFKKFSGNDRGNPETIVALDKSTVGIMVVSPDDIYSAWFVHQTDELKKMKIHKGMLFILAVQRDIDKFKKNARDSKENDYIKHAIFFDFSDETQIKKRLREILIFINGDYTFDVNVTQATKINNEVKLNEINDISNLSYRNEKEFIEYLLNLAKRNQFVALLDRHERWIKINKQLGELLIESNWDILNIHLPSDPKATPGQYFSDLAKIIGTNIQQNNFLDCFKNKLEDHICKCIKSGKNILFLITEPDTFSFNCRKMFDDILVALNEKYGNSIAVLICGKETLENFLYKDDTMQFINKITAIENWPDPTIDDAQRIINSLDLQIAPRDEMSLAENLLIISGGNRDILEDLVNLIPKNQKDTNIIIDLYQRPIVNRIFKKMSTEIDAICKFLKNFFVSDFELYIDNSFIRKLFWKNLIKQDKKSNKFVWRSDALRKAGIKILKCEAGNDKYNS